MMHTGNHVIYKLRNAEVLAYPFPHFYARNVFPEDFYWKMVRNLPPSEQYSEMGGSYPNRSFGPKDVPDGCEFMVEEYFLNQVAMIFLPWYRKRYGDKNIKIASDLRLVRDQKGYQIGPHTDAPWKMVSLLFYLPQNYGYRDHGTSIYTPKIRGFTCKGGPHYDHDGFNQVWTAPYEPNTCFGFWKTDNSFHGVEPVEDSFNRDVLLFNLYDESLIPQKAVKLGESTPEETSHGDARPEGPE